MKIIVIASNNPVKRIAVENGFSKMFPGEQFGYQSISAPSNVSDQPLSSKETLQGALNRARNAAQLLPDADFCVGIEGGIEIMGEEMAAFAWVVVQSNQLLGKGRTGTFFLPAAVAELIQQGLELGDADDLVFGQYNSKQANGAIGILTDNVIDRAQLYEHAVILALVPFKNTHQYFA